MSSYLYASCSYARKVACVHAILWFSMLYEKSATPEPFVVCTLPSGIDSLYCTAETAEDVVRRDPRERRREMNSIDLQRPAAAVLQKRRLSAFICYLTLFAKYIQQMATAKITGDGHLSERQGDTVRVFAAARASAERAFALSLAAGAVRVCAFVRPSLPLCPISEPMSPA